MTLLDCSVTLWLFLFRAIFQTLNWVLKYYYLYSLNSPDLKKQEKNKQTENIQI